MGFFDQLFGKQGGEEQQAALPWQPLRSLNDLEAALAQSENEKIVLFKHSTRCSISSMAKKRLERSWDYAEGQGPKMYFLDLIAYREISNAIAEELGVMHQSPQLIVVQNGQALMDCSHSDIRWEELQAVL
ncbi:bacillithiol system redox-active protein YtxJ [Saprospira sp. CCB-QB6]|uniref:General stress protein n=1 Tax=Saprospira grandis (strain Lewin) TaxID=984262 RepID=H6KZB5_SAPGL|nr:MULTISPECIES: bacillithiol system redox-active protein YtxJ [Saprospira]AFC24505.1 general stress protein [Saprospira grandis str. Lewin]WCL82767.1 bacillithiol system redox-active protein YtxJ [Saprospira sp. CCB-QB6]